VNTQYKKQEKYLCTYHKPTAEHMKEIIPTRETKDQYDYWLIGRRWRNMITNAETEPNANISTDHDPLIITATFKLKATRPVEERKDRTKYTKNTEKKTGNKQNIYKGTNNRKK
jgi:hypothetical protein